MAELSEKRKNDELCSRAEIYDPKTSQFFISDKLPYKNTGFFSKPLTLDYGNVLVISDDGNAVIYKTGSGMFHLIPGMTIKRSYPVVRRLQDGRVLVLGGSSDGIPQKSAEIFDPKTETFQLAGEMSTTRGSYFDAVVLKDGRVLITGGTIFHDQHWYAVYNEHLNTAEIFDPQTRQFYPAGRMKHARASHKSFLLDDGSVLIVGGGSGHSGIVRYAELYIPGKYPI